MEYLGVEDAFGNLLGSAKFTNALNLDWVHRDTYLCASSLFELQLK